MPGWTTAQLGEIERIPTADPGVDWVPLRDHLDVRALGINVWVGDAGADLIGLHDERDPFAGGHEELYLVLAGRARFVLGEIELEAPAGTIVAVHDRAPRRAAQALEEGTSVLTLGAEPGRPFAIAAWEFLVRAGAQARAGNLEAAITTLSGGLDARPESAELRYHRACYESLAGRRDEALTDLRAAIEIEPKNAERARAEPDFDAPRADGSLETALS